MLKQLLLLVSKKHNYKITHNGPKKQERGRELTSMVLSLKYLMYSGPIYRGGLHVIRNTKHGKKRSEETYKACSRGFTFKLSQRF